MKRLHRSPFVRRLAPLLGISIIVASGACGSSKAMKSGTGGAAIGAVASGLLGGNMVTGALVGGGLGYIAGNEADKRAAEQQLAAERARAEQSRITADQATAYQPERSQLNPLVGSSWQLIALDADEEIPEWSGAVVTFATNSRVTTLAMYADGSTESWVESYRIVDDVIIFSGTEDGQDYAVPMKMSVDASQMVLVASDFRAVLNRIEESA